jgi:hypothetical protein
MNAAGSKTASGAMLTLDAIAMPNANPKPMLRRKRGWVKSTWKLEAENLLLRPTGGIEVRGFSSCGSGV